MIRTLTIILLLSSSAHAASPTSRELLGLTERAALDVAREAYSEALARCDEVIEAIGNDTSAELQVPLASAWLLKAKALRLLGRTGDALNAYGIYLTIPTSKDREEERLVHVRIAELEEKLRVAAERAPKATFGRLRLTTTPTDATVRIDGLVLHRNNLDLLALAPGEHAIVVAAAGFVTAMRVVRITADTETHEVVTLDAAQPRAPRSSWREPAAITVATVGGVALVTGVVGLVLAADRQDKLDAATLPDGTIDTTRLPPTRALALADERDTFNGVGIGALVGAGLCGAAVVLILVTADDSSVESLDLSWLPGGGYIGWSGSF